MAENESTVTLTGNDLALASFGVMHMLSWWRSQPDCSFKKKSVAEAEETLRKLDAISNYAYPYQDQRDVPFDCGGEEIVTVNKTVVMRTREAARRASEGGAS